MITSKKRLRRFFEKASPAQSAPRKAFFLTYTPSEKTIRFLSRLRARNPAGLIRNQKQVFAGGKDLFFDYASSVIPGGSRNSTNLTEYRSAEMWLNQSGW